MQLVKDFFRDIDRQWSLHGETKVQLRIIGSTALMLQTDYARGTKDSDVIETVAITPALKEHLLNLAPQDPESEMFKKYRMYIDVVGQGIPFLPQMQRCHPLNDLNTSLTHLELEVLDVVDVMISKLKRFNVNDRRDIQEMVDRGLVDNDQFVERFRAAIDSCSMAAINFREIVKNFHYVQYEMMMTSETSIELPSFLE